MKSIEVIVPRKLIKGFYPHPEYYGDFIVELKNGMITDIYYNAEGDFKTITGEQELISYLHNQKASKNHFLLRNGVFAFRLIDITDNQQFKLWEKCESKTKLDIINTKVELNSLNIPSKMIVTFYWIEIGYVELKQTDKGIIITFYIYEIEFINILFHHKVLLEDELDIFMQIIKEYVLKKLLII